MSQRRLGRYSLTDDVTPVLTPVPSRSMRPPAVWARVEIDGDSLVARLSGWRVVLAMKRSVVAPVAAVTAITADPAPRATVSAKLRRKAGRSGLYRLGTYHSFQGWSFWAVGLGRNAVVIELNQGRYQFLVLEVADPSATVAEVRRAAGLAE